jgi:hypothetical protein
MVGHQVYADATSGSPIATDGLYAVTVTSFEDAALGTNQFKYTAPNSQTAAGNMTIRRCTLRQSNGVSSVTDVGTGDYVVNLQQEFPDANYSAMLTGQRGDGTTGGFLALAATSNNTMSQTATRFRIGSFNSSGGAIDYAIINVAVFR